LTLVQLGCLRPAVVAGFSTVTELEEEAVKPRESVHVALTVTVPAGAPVVFRVAEFPLRKCCPAGSQSRPPTVTGTLSGLVQVQLMVVVAPVIDAGRTRRAGNLRRVLGWLFDREVRSATRFVVLFRLGSVTRAVTV